MTKDLSCVGACLKTQEVLPSNRKLNMKIYLSDQKFFPVEGHVVWNRSSDSGNSVGVIFDNISPEMQELILQYAFEIKKEDVIKNWYKGWNAAA